MTRAYRDGNKFVVANLAYLTVVFSSALGAWLWRRCAAAGRAISPWV